MKNITSLAVAFLIILFFSGCKKETTEHKIMNKIYDVENFTIDGLDYTDSVKSSLNYSYISFIIDDFGDKSIKAHPCPCNYSTGAIGVIGGWYASNSILMMNFNGASNSSNNYGAFWNLGDINWEIITVSGDKLSLEVLYLNKKNELHLTNKLKP